ncbi:unnamed protein product [Camellia sinensis]
MRHVEEEVLQWIAQKPDHHFSFPFRGEPQTYEPPRSALSFSRRRARHGTPHEMIKSEPQTYEPRRGALSFSRRRARQRTPHEMIKLQVGPMITSQSVPGQNIVLVRPRTLGQTNPKEHNGLVPMEGDEEIFEEEAACKFCFVVLKKENILKTECKCSNALIHEECAAKWSRTRGNNNCDSCGQVVETFPVTLVRGLSSSTQVVDREESNKWSLFSWLMRIWKA